MRRLKSLTETKKRDALIAEVIANAQKSLEKGNMSADTFAGVVCALRGIGRTEQITYVYSSSPCCCHSRCADRCSLCGSRYCNGCSWSGSYSESWGIGIGESRAISESSGEMTSGSTSGGSGFGCTTYSPQFGHIPHALLEE